MTPSLAIPTALLLLLLTPSLSQQCPPGSVRANATCVPCPPGTFRGPSSPRCQPCFSGTFSASGSVARDLCRPCPAGTFSARDATPSCTACPPGAFSPPSSRRCETCPAGSRILPTGRCRVCPRGTFSAAANSLACADCPPSFTSDEGAASQAACRRCPPGTHGPLCEPCPPGSFNDATRPFCQLCPAGFTSPRGAAACAPCASGSFGDGGVCFPCPPGTTTQGRGDVCRRPDGACPPGSLESNGACLRCDRGSRIARGRCRVCPEGTASPGGIVTTCTECPNGVDRFDRSLCLCAPGFGRRRDGQCRRCRRGQESFLDGCRACPPGTFARKSATPKCAECPVGSVAEEGSTRCTKCGNGLIENARRERCVSPTTNCAIGFRRRDGADEFGNWAFWDDCVEL